MDGVGWLDPKPASEQDSRTTRHSTDTTVRIRATGSIDQGGLLCARGAAALAVCLELAIILMGASGCTVVRLGQRTMNQANTLPDLQYQQVLDNLARFADNPSALPWHVNFREGTAQVTDSLSGGAALDTGPPVGWFPQLLGSRTVVAQWGMTPVINATELRLLRFAYRRAFGFPEVPDPEFLNDLAHELKNQLPSNVDQRDESELFYEYHSHGIRDYPEFNAKVTTTNDDDVCKQHEHANDDALAPGSQCLPPTGFSSA